MKTTTTAIVGVGFEASAPAAPPAADSAPAPKRAARLSKNPGRYVEDMPREEVRVRRWDAATTDRLNESHWQYAHGNSINVDLASDLEMLRARCAYELANNPIVEGVVSTFVDDVVGKYGPRLQVVSESDEFNEAVESYFKTVFNSPDPSRGSHGVETLAGCVRQLWPSGEYLLHVIDTDRAGPVTVGFRPYHPRRLANPPLGQASGRVAFGVEFTEEGVPVQYWIQDREETGEGTIPFRPRYSPVSADQIQHVFKRLEPEQIRGVPWLAPALPAIADLRQLDKHVIEAAKHAAAQAAFWYTDNPDAEFDESVSVGDSAEIEPGTTTVGPAGWKLSTLQSTQPASTYVEFRHERLREIGRPANMPMMTVLLSSADSNFASAHYDGQVYARSIDCVRGLIERATLVPVVEQIITELVLSGVVTRPDDYELVWKWKRPPQADPKKQREADRLALEDGTAAYAHVLETSDYTFEELVSTRGRESEALVEAGLPVHPVNHGRGGGGGAPDQEEGNEGGGEAGESETESEEGVLSE